MKRENLRKAVRKSLVEQLKAKGADIDLYKDQVNDYMMMWDLKEKLKDDIEENGLRMKYKAANGGSVESFRETDPSHQQTDADAPEAAGHFH